MPHLLDRTPFLDRATEVVVRGERVRVRANQIIAWVSLTIPRVKSHNPVATPFPVIVDTGYTHSLAIHERHLIEWAGLRPDVLPFAGATRDRDRRIPLRGANIWLHPNVPGTRDELADRPPYRIEAAKGIAVYPAGEFPRLPLLGLRAVAENRLVLNANGRRRRATLRTPAWWRPFD